MLEGIGISVVCPVYRNAETIPELCAKVAEAAAQIALDYEIILVVDDSPDASFQVAKDLRIREPRIGILLLARNYGQHVALRAGLRLCRGDRIVIMDADLQDPPEAIPALVAKLDEGHQAVIAGRVGRYQSRRRMLSSRFFKRLQAQVCRLPVNAGAFVALSNPARDRLLEIRDPGKATLPQQIGLQLSAVTSIPIARVVRPVGKSAYSSGARLKVGIASLVSALRLRFFSWFPVPEAEEPDIASWEPPQ